ncbi:arsenate reductase/protein-tyrosine-phosphatase family protein [Demequina activiva]|uniref:Regulatory protein, ArsR family n=1 Tax=Demequina activiva TaxID=1582364 RepID=A0A919UIX6_9MICO|nr:helix-turn-helix domain-containing protein [Demequina activiva]GIG53801.1 putative regulatory protein, ArsR family [Demequina activiva]
MTDRLTLLSALADPQRLRIVDALALGDTSPTALSRDLDLPSNLLAHHIGVLTEAGVVRRRRSDGDGRRSYLALDWETPLVAATVTGSPALGACRVVFVCTANAARSQFAASLFARQSDVPVASAGTHPADQINPYALAELDRHGLGPLDSRPRALEDAAREGDLIVAVCDNAYEDLEGRAQLHWSVPDPAATDAPEAFADSFAQIEPRVQRLAAALTPGASS